MAPSLKCHIIGSILFNKDITQQLIKSKKKQKLSHSKRKKR